METLRDAEVVRVEKDELAIEKESLIMKVKELDAYSMELNKTLQETRGAL